MNKQKVIGLIIGVVLFLSMVAGITYAFLSWQSENINRTVNSKCFEIFYDKGTDITGVIMPSTDYTGGLSTTVKMDINSSCDIDAVGKIYLNTSEETSNNLYRYGLLNYQVLKEGEVTDIKGSITGTGEIELNLGQLAKNTSAVTEYTIYVWVDNDLVINSDANSVYSGSIRSEAIQDAGQLSSSENETLIDHITNLYQENYDSSYDVTFADGTGMNYYAPDVSLMNDGLDISGNMTNNAYKGNIRYYGASPNNYIYFNCDEYPDTGCEIWRIIGIVDGKVKIIKDESIGNLSWDALNNEGADTSKVNNWENASLQLFLNGKYYDRGTTDTLIYYSGSNGTTETPLNLVDIGITSATREANLISPSTWYLGGYSTSSELYADDIYVYERTNEVGTTIFNGNPFILKNANIGLMYASDYGYGVDLNSCTEIINSYNSANCTGTNWLFNSSYQWLITPVSSGSGGAWRVSSTGNASGFNVTSAITGVRPVLYLDSSVVIESGYDGSEGNEYRINVS